MFRIPLLPKPISLVAIHLYGNSALLRAYSKVNNGKSRHISLRHDLVQRLITKGVITFDYVNIKFNLADKQDHLKENRAPIRTTEIGPFPSTME